MRPRDERFAAGRVLPLVALVAAAAATCLLGCRSKLGRRGPPAAPPDQPDVPTFREEAEPETAVVAAREPEPETVAVVEERPPERPESQPVPAPREEGGVPPPGTAADEDAIQAAKRLAPQRRGDWCVKGPAAFPELAGRLIMGTRSLSGVRNPALARQAVAARARAGAARTLRTSATKALAGWLEGAAGLQAAERGMLIETAVKNVFRRVLVKTEIVDSYVDGGTDTHCALVALRTDLVKAALRDEIERLAGSLGLPADRIIEAKLRELLQDAFGPKPAALGYEDVVRSVKRLAKERRDDWPFRGSAAFPEFWGRLIMGVGSFSGVRNSKLVEQAAAARARQKLAGTLKTFVAAVAREYLQSVIAGEMGEAELDQVIGTIQKNVTRTTLVGCKIVDKHYDERGNTWYSLAKLEVHDVAMELRKQMFRVERTRKLRIPAVNAHRKLDRIIEAKLQELPQDAFVPKPAAPAPEEVF